MYLIEITWHLHCIERTGMQYDFPSTIVYKMLRSIPFHVHCIANRLDPAMSLRILLGSFRRLSIHMNIRVVKMPILMQFGPDMVGSKINSTARSSLSRSLLYVFDLVHSRWEQFWLQFFWTGCTQKFNRYKTQQQQRQPKWRWRKTKRNRKQFNSPPLPQPPLNIHTHTNERDFRLWTERARTRTRN